ncbi:hypothetical protein MPSEU_001022900 [Mayamaea pseudoterrestris]|nr:hypothetical protein MPSEU_001022900 [Mayamaea pseudoterrestris]
MKLELLLSFLLASAGSINAFTVTRNSRHAAVTFSSSPSLLFSEPSDTSSDTSDDMYIYEDAIVDAESQPYEPMPAEAAVSNILDLMPTKLLGDSVSDATRSAINEALLSLERLNPTRDAAVSPLLNGVWELKYVGGYTPEWALPSPTRQLALFLYSGGYSPGVFCLQLAQQLPSALVEILGDLTLTIRRDQPRVEASMDVKLLFGNVQSTVKVQTKLEAQSSMRLRETYESAKLLDQNVPVPQALQYTRDLYITYLDDDLLVVRDASGVPEVLVRKQFRTTSVREPDSLDGLTPPGMANGEN